MNIIEMSLQASAMIAVIIIVRALGVNRLPKWGFQVLWDVVLARLLVPIRVEFHLSAYNVVQQFGRTLPTTLPVDFTSANARLTATMTAKPAHAVASAVAAVSRISPWLLLWLIGAALVFTYFVMMHLQGRKIYSKAHPLYQARAKRAPLVEADCHQDVMPHWYAAHLRRMAPSNPDAGIPPGWRKLRLCPRP